MAGSSPLDIVTAYQDAWTSRDFETAASHLAEDFVFRSEIQQMIGRKEFMPFLSGFASRMMPRWEKLAATTEDDNVLILYNLFPLEDLPGTCADYFTVRNGKIQSETLVFDPKPFVTARDRRQAGA